MQVIRSLRGSAAAIAMLALSSPADGDVAARGEVEDLELRLTLSTFLYREAGADAAPIVDQGAPLQNASSARRYFGDMRAELTSKALAFDGRVRQTGSARAQSGALGGDEYDLRTLAYRIDGGATRLTIGRQHVDAVGATKVDGAAVSRSLGRSLAATLFGGFSPDVGSRSVTTDYGRAPETGSRLVPLIGGLGVSYRAPDYHGDAGIAVVHVGQEVPGATSTERSRVVAASNGYWRVGAPLSVFHIALVDVAGNGGANLTTGSLGVTAQLADALQLTGTIHHVGTDLFQLAARDALAEPDPSAMGIVQNDVALVRVSQDAVRAAASLALAARRFELALSGSARRRGGVSIALADGSGAVAFAPASSADVTFGILDRRSIGGLRLAVSGTLLIPVGNDAPNRARGKIVRAAASRTVGAQRGELELDVMAERLRDATGASGMCTGSFDALACFGTSRTTAVQAGGLASWRAGREWLLIADAHVGYQDVDSRSLAGPIAWPRVWSLTTFIRVQWRYR
jgi:hypothetical protein